MVLVPSLMMCGVSIFSYATIKVTTCKMTWCFGVKFIINKYLLDKWIQAAIPYVDADNCIAMNKLYERSSFLCCLLWLTTKHK